MLARRKGRPRTQSRIRTLESLHTPQPTSFVLGVVGSVNRKPAQAATAGFRQIDTQQHDVAACDGAHDQSVLRRSLFHIDLPSGLEQSTFGSRAASMGPCERHHLVAPEVDSRFPGVALEGLEHPSSVNCAWHSRPPKAATAASVEPVVAFTLPQEPRFKCREPEQDTVLTNPTLAPHGEVALVRTPRCAA